MSARRPNPLSWMVPMSALALAGGILLGRGSEAASLGMAAMPGALLAAGLSRGRTRRAALLLAVACLGFIRGYAAYHPALPEEGSYTVTGVVADEVRVREDGQMRTILRHVTLNGQPLYAGAYWTAYPRELPEGVTPGATVTLTARVYHPDGADNPGGFDFKEYLLQRSVTVGAYGLDDLRVEPGGFTLIGAMARLRHRLTHGLIAAMGEEAGGYAAAMLLGNRELIVSEDRAAFNKLGIAHILSVSGYHVGVLAGLMEMLFRRLKTRRSLRMAMTAAVLAAYCLLTGMNPPVIRAAMLAVLYQVGRLRRRQNLGLHLLSASAILMLLISPTLLTGASFQLSYGAMLGLLLVYPVLERSALLRGSRFRGLWLSLGAAASAQLGILVPQLYWFQELPLISLPLNVLVLSGAGLLMSMYWLALAVLPCPPAAAFVGGAAGFVTQRALGVIRSLSNLEGIVMWVRQANALTLLGWVLVVAGLSCLWTRRRAPTVLLGTALILLSLLPWPHTGVSYIQFDVGSADAALIHDRDALIAVDAGADGEALATYLKQRRLSLDALILTHLHADHAGGIRALLDDGIPVAAVYLPAGATDAAIDGDMLPLLEELLGTGTELRFLARGDAIPLPDGVITAVWPEAEGVRAGLDANLHSLVLHVDLPGATMLLTGDLDGAYEAYAAVPADILKVAHHGSVSSTSQAFLAAVSPETLILSCGDAARQASMEERRGDIPLYGTREHGAVMIDFTPDGYAVRTMH